VIHIKLNQGSNAKLWWPNGYGDQNLYTYEVIYQSANQIETSTKSLRVGFRKVELIQDLVDANRTEWGEYTRLFI
jgi:beta-galactosidase/beta-glucuronidase